LRVSDPKGTFANLYLIQECQTARCLIAAKKRHIFAVLVGDDQQFITEQTKVARGPATRGHVLDALHLIAAASKYGDAVVASHGHVNEPTVSTHMHISPTIMGKLCARER
jgi:hypothetical protein